MYGTLNSLIRLNKLLSNSHAEISLIRDAPSFNASLATSCRNVSTEIIASGILLFMLLIIGIILSISIFVFRRFFMDYHF